MTGTLPSASQALTLEALHERVVEVETVLRLGTTDQRDVSSEAIATAIRVAWGVDGILTTGISNEWPFFEGDEATLGIFYAKIPSTTTTSTIVEVRRNGVAIAGSAITLVAGTAIEGTVQLAEAFADGDVYQVAVTTAGAGAEDLQTLGRFE